MSKLFSSKMTLKSKRLFVFLLALLLFLSFIFFSYLVAKEKFVQIDFDTTVKLQDNIPRKFDLPFSVFSVLGLAEFTVLAWAIILIITFFKRFFLASLALFLFWFGLFLEIFGKLFVLHPGPPFFFYRGVIKLNLPTYYVHTDYSYPSGHVYRSAFLVSFILAWVYFRRGKFAKLVVFLGLLIYLIIMFISRVYLGEHWLSDVIGGTLLGSSFGLLAGIFIPNKSNLKAIDLKETS